jgi:hypothetical protein
MLQDGSAGFQSALVRHPVGHYGFSVTEILSVCAVVICLAVVSCERAPDPADTIRNAYSWYVRTLKSDTNPLQHDRSEMRKFATEAFLTSLDNLRPELENNPYLDADSFDAKLHIEEVKVDGRSARARITLTGRMFGIHRLNMQLLKEARAWKIDDVKLFE